jgi:hypothetical protein
MTWLDTAIEQAGNPIIVDIRDLDLGQDAIEVMPLSAGEYQVLKSHPEMRGLTEPDEKQERLGLLMVCEMMQKCDKEVTWAKLKQLPLQTLAALSNKITLALGTTQGGGVLGES